MRSVVIFSGGLDSTVLLYRAVEDDAGPKMVSAISFNYGQRHSKELDAAYKIASDLGVANHRIVDLSDLRTVLAGSSQTSKDVEVPEGHYADKTMRATVVPNRNMIMISVAIGWAVSIGAESVQYGAHAGDHAIYPDCRPEFVLAMGVAADIGNYRKVGIKAPFIDIEKHEIVSSGVALKVPFGDTWSCYKGGEFHCGKCGTCVERVEAFSLAGVRDPTVYR